MLIKKIKLSNEESIIVKEMTGKAKFIDYFVYFFKENFWFSMYTVLYFSWFTTTCILNKQYLWLFISILLLVSIYSGITTSRNFIKIKMKHL